MVIMKQDRQSIIDTRSGLVFTVTELPRQWRVDCHTIDGSTYILGIYDDGEAARAALKDIYAAFPLAEGYYNMPPRKVAPEGA